MATSHAKLKAQIHCSDAVTVIAADMATTAGRCRANAPGPYPGAGIGAGTWIGGGIGWPAGRIGACGLGPEKPGYPGAG